jgi:hypothetical protein
VRPGLNVTWSCGCTTWVHPRTKTKPRITPTGGSFGFCNTRAHQLVRAVSSIFILPRMCVSCETGRHVRCNGRVDGKPCHCPLLLEHGMYPLQTTVDRLLEQTVDGE